MSEKNKKIQIRNSTVEFLIFTSQTDDKSIEARFEDETIWLTQKLMSELFDIGVNTINYHLKETYKTGEIEENRTIRKFRIVQTEGKRQAMVAQSKPPFNLISFLTALELTIV